MTQVTGYIDEIPMLEYRKSWPIAVMIAQMGNFSGGRPTKKPKKVSDSVPYKPEDFLQYMWFAQYEPYLELTRGEKPEVYAVDKAALQELYDRRNELSSMFYSSLPWREIRERLGITED